ncbi:hypothetical protein COY95_01255 [Candidatus Woesearchaeota archaeon CG_4_10_14_0_8_um_filter_47_5]|nr:MAG: hypothetical protein COY95_01255 [Candidatus Woesearchaeota archaeon CG_4_10_14_0_8_um_filter_47_5]
MTGETGQRSLVFDSGPIISLTTANLLWILEPLKKKFNGRFLITPGVKEEIVNNPLKTKRFKFEALQILDAVNEGILEIVENSDIDADSETIIDMANTLFLAKGHPIRIVHTAEIEALAAALFYKSSAVIIDERTTRLLIEDPPKLQYLLRKKLHTPIEVDTSALLKLKDLLGEVKVLRSVELATVAFEMGLLESIITNKNNIVIDNPHKTLLEGMLWGIKLNGCAVSEQEIKRIIKLAL